MKIKLSRLRRTPRRIRRYRDIITVFARYGLADWLKRLPAELGLQPESSLRGNVIHDVPVNVGRAESNGMFLDQGTGGFTIAENVIYNITRSPLRFHKGWENLVRDNVLAVYEGVPVVRYNDTKEERIQLQDNRVVKATPSQPNPVAEAARSSEAML